MAIAEKSGISIFLRILFFFMLVNIATSIVLILLAYNFNRESIERRTKENIAQQIDSLHQIFDQQYVTTLKRSLSTIAASSALDDYLQASAVERPIAQKRLERMFLQLLRDFDDFHSASFVDADGKIMIEVVGKLRRRVPLSLETGQVAPADLMDAATFAASAQLFKLIKSIPVLLSSGNMEWFMPTREMQISSPHVDRHGHVSFVAGIAKVDLDTGSFGGVVMVHERLDEFLNGLRAVTFFDENPIWVFDENGRALQRPENEGTTFDPSEHLTASFQAGLEIAGTERGIVAYRDFAIAPGRPFLRVAVAIPSALLFKDFSPAIRFFSAVLAVSLIVVFAVALYVSRYLSNPIVELAAAAARLAGGDLETRVKVRTTGEVQILVDSFNRMTSRLRETIASRDESVHSLEAEVAVRKRAEEQLTRQAEELTGARIAAEDASRAKSNFLAKMSHEIRTPMIGVLGMTDLLGRTELGGRQQRLVGILRQSAETLLNIINDILDFSRIEAGKLALDRVEFELRDLVTDVVELLAEPAQSKALEIVYALEAPVPEWLCGDPHRLRQVLMNLIGNAIKFTERGEVEITVALERLGEEAVILRFQVRDTGIGIALGDRTDLFQAFEQADGSISRRYGGTGLGLSIAQQLVTMMGGEMGVESTPGQGSTFWFTASFDRCRQPPASAGGQDCDLSGARVLLVDDNATNREVLCQYLADSGADCRVAAGGAEALVLLRAGGLGLAILDMKMPGMDGIELARRIAESPEIADIPLILLTSIYGEDAREMADSVDICATLTKPVRPKELCQQVARFLDRPGAEAEPEAPADPAPALPGDGNAVPASVLLAEDNPVNQEVAREYLAALGCRVEIVETGAAAINAFHRRRHDLILMDCQMPEMDGLEATRQIRQAERRDTARPRMPIVAVTAFTTEGERERCLAAGMDDYLAKPFDQEELRAVLLRCLPESLRSADAEAVPPEEPPLEDPPTEDTAIDSHAPVLDQVALGRIRAVGRNSGRDVLSKVVGIYLQQMPIELEALAAAVARGDAIAVAQLAHKLKSSSGNVGAQRLAERFGRLERMAHDGALGESRAVLAEIQREFGRAELALEAELSGGATLSESA